MFGDVIAIECVEHDQVVAFRVAHRSFCPHTRVVFEDVHVLGGFESEIALCNDHDGGIDLHDVDARVRIQLRERRRQRAAAESHHQHVGRRRIEQQRGQHHPRVWKHEVLRRAPIDARLIALILANGELHTAHRAVFGDENVLIERRLRVDHSSVNRHRQQSCRENQREPHDARPTA